MNRRKLTSGLMTTTALLLMANKTDMIQLKPIHSATLDPSITYHSYHHPYVNKFGWETIVLPDNNGTLRFKVSEKPEVDFSEAYK